MRSLGKTPLIHPQPGPTAPREEHRRAKREPDTGVTAMVHRANGAVLEGVVRDSSASGMKIAVDPIGLGVGDAVDVVVVVQGERVRFACEIKHVDPAAKSVGLLFRSGPHAPGGPSENVRRCMQCRRDFSIENNYCSHCGQRLVTR